MEYVTSKEIAETWGVSNRRVNKLCNDSRIIGAYKNGLMWVIPKNAKKPEDLRKNKLNFSALQLELGRVQKEYEEALEIEFRKSNGIYYTPYELVDLMFHDLNISRNSVILDPCCGMGSFIIGALKRGYSNIYGVDIDQKAVGHISKLLKSDKVTHYDSINNSAESTLQKIGIKKPDLVVGNPPFVPHGSIFGNLFVGSIIRSLDMLKSGGLLSYIIPKNFLHVTTYKELRKNLLSNYQIISIVDIGVYFKNVRGEQIVLTIKNAKPTAESQIIFKELKDGTFIDRSKIKQNNFSDIIRVYMSEYELTIYDKLSTAYKNLEDYCQGYIARGRSKDLNAISGKDIKKFGFKNQVVPEKGSKIFIQNIYSSESGIIGSFAGNLEAKETVTVITDSEPEKCKYLVGLLHSRLINYFLFKYCFNSSRLTLHTDKKYISQIPIAIASNEKYQKVINYVDELQETDYLSDIWYEVFEKLNKLVYEIYGLNQNEEKFIETSMKSIQSTRWTKGE